MHRIIQDSDDEEAEEEPTTAAPVDCDIISTIRTATNSTESTNDNQDGPGILDPEKASGARGTDSSETMMRQQLETAHLALFNSTPSSNKLETNGATALLATQSTQKLGSLKRVKTTGGDVQGQEIQADRALKRRKTAQTYGGKNGRGFSGEVWDVPSSSDSAKKITNFDATQETMTPSRHKIATPTPLLSLDSQSPGSYDVGRADFLAHDPNELFPESISTLESGKQTLEISQTEEEHTRISLNSDGLERRHLLDVAPTVDQHISISNDEYLAEISLGKAQKNRVETSVEEQQVAAQLYSNDIEQQRVAVVPSRGQNVTVQISKPSGESAEDYGPDRFAQKSKAKKFIQEDDDSIPNGDVGSTKIEDDRGEGSSAKFDKGAEREASSHVKLPQPAPEDDHASGTYPRAGKEKEKTHVDSPEAENEFNSDELGIDLPKEMYQPRPSKSRGSRDPSNAQPNLPAPTASKPAKTRLRRHKTTGAISAYSSSLREMGFRSSQVEMALTEANGNFDDALEKLTTRQDSVFGSQGRDAQKVEEEIIITTILEEDEPRGDIVDYNKKDTDEQQVTIKNAGKKSKVARQRSGRGRPKKQAVIEHNDSNDDEHNVDDDPGGEANASVVKTTGRSVESKKQQDLVSHDQTAKEEVSHVSDSTEEEREEEAQVAPVVGTKKRVRGGKKKVEPHDVEEILEDEPLHGSTDDEVQTAPVVVVKKKARGRPKKTPKPAEEHAESEDDAAADVQHRRPISIKANTKTNALEELDPNVPPKETHNHDTSAQHEQENQHTATPPQNNGDRNVTPAKKTTEELAKPVAASVKPHSPLKTARVPLKVGLSRRARIEPLLRIVRK